VRAFKYSLVKTAEYTLRAVFTTQRTTVNTKEPNPLRVFNKKIRFQIIELFPPKNLKKATRQSPQTLSSFHALLICKQLDEFLKRIQTIVIFISRHLTTSLMTNMHNKQKCEETKTGKQNIDIEASQRPCNQCYTMCECSYKEKSQFRRSYCLRAPLTDTIDATELQTTTGHRALFVS
jgi:hypothetical protein